MKLYKINKNEPQRRKLKKKVLNYALENFGYQKTIDDWHDTMLSTLKEFKGSSQKSWKMKTY